MARGRLQECAACASHQKPVTVAAGGGGDHLFITTAGMGSVWLVSMLCGRRWHGPEMSSLSAAMWGRHGYSDFCQWNQFLASMM